MSGYYNRVTQDGAFNAALDQLNDSQYDYVLYRSAAMRQNRVEAPLMMPAQNVDFYGPLAGNRVTKESFMQGRGGTLSKDPNNQVNYLPASLFNQPPLKSKCDRVDMLPEFTRVKPTCNGLRETSITAYNFCPENYKEGYQGYNSVVYTNLETRVGPDYNPNAYRQCQQNYASYAPTRDFSRYAP